MKIRTRLAGAITGTAMVGITAFALGTAAPAGAVQQTQPAKSAVTSTATVQPTLAQDCWGDDCWWDDDGDWDGGWGWGWGW
jgi:hypothetical protein